MTERTQHVLDAIDGALDDWTVGPDAMRWTAEPEPPPITVTITADTSGFERALQQLRESLAVSAAQAAEGLRRMAAALRLPQAPSSAERTHIRTAYRQRSLARRRRR